MQSQNTNPVQRSNILLAFLFLCFCSSFAIQASENIFKKGLRLSPEVFQDDTSGGFNPALLYLLDENEGVYLFRGDLPEIDDTFCYITLIDAIKSNLAEKGKTLSDNAQLCDLSFLNYIAERRQIDIEKKWLTTHPELGFFRLDSLYGALFNPCDLSDEFRRYILTHHDIDGLKSLMGKLKDIMDGQYKTDLVVYMHCNAGKDRTGEAAAAYLMQYKGYSYDDAVQLDLKIADRPLRDLSMNAIRWYAFYLREIHNMSTIGRIDGK